MGAPGKPVELTFQFDTVRNFSAMVLHTNNMFSKGVQVSVTASRYYTSTVESVRHNYLEASHRALQRQKVRDINNVNRAR